jgi:hypothetical protein
MINKRLSCDDIEVTRFVKQHYYVAESGLRFKAIFY